MKRVSLILISILLFISNAFPQKSSKLYVVKGSAKIAEGELVSKSIRDANGQVCAGLIIKTDLTGLSFDSYNGIVKLNSKPGRYFLFLSPNERVVEVYKMGYEPLKIILYDYDIYLKSGRVWEIKVTGDKPLDLIPINIIREPQDAAVYIDGKLQPKGTTFKVSEGKHILMIKKKGYYPIKETINVSMNNTLFNYKLNLLNEINVIIRSNPQGARIYFDSIEQGETDTAFWTLEGKHSVKLIKSGFFEIDTTIVVKANSKNDFKFNLIKNVGILKLNVTPPDAEIWFYVVYYG